MSKRYATVLVEGESMLPTYAPGDWLMAKWGGFLFKSEGTSPAALFGKVIGVIFGNRVSVGEVVVIERPEQPGILYVKRITEIKPESYQVFVSSDNPAGTDSRQWGWLPILAVRAKVTGRVRRARK